MSTREPRPEGYALQILALAGDIKDLRIQLGDLAGIGTQLTALGDAVSKVEAKLAEIARDELEQPPQLWDWTTMNRDQAHAAWSVLFEWVDTVLVGTYNAVSAEQIDQDDVKIPACWYRHPQAVAELGWLCQEWLRIYRTSKGTPAAAGEWHDRWLTGALKRLYRSLRKCADSLNGHHDAELGSSVDDPDAFWEFVSTDLDHRPEAPAPGLVR